ncbi:LuxR family transcriptional regulator [Paenibacillus oenotherae]|uniref:LuxR family transcriptional regulator n=1 Tax=Paenibacillus oenotherae TaxID=1435645 RepID=A0ABS7D277_9BACL|nr:LuxR family transcriptional regulator [Paenibacillus oenotherae]MBW7473953.1 LuxR family transcriptional regulator [Paenibacillus oenotherae]
MKESERLEQLESLMLVGRGHELQSFAAILGDESFSHKIINVYGTAGIGKSFLLDEFQRQARMAGACPIAIDCEHLVKTPEALCRAILQVLDRSAANASSASADIAEQCIRTLNGAMPERTVLFIDVYEQLAAMDHWLRDYFLKQLHRSILIVIAGRHPLSEPWFVSPVWRQFIHRMPLAELDYQSVERYAGCSSINDNERIQQIWRHSKGHPLTMSLVTYISQQLDMNETDTPLEDYGSLPYIVNQWLREVPDDSQRALVETAALLRFFNQESLSFVMDRDIALSEFHQLIRCSFIRKVDNGWTVHALMRELINRELLSRSPDLFEDRRTRVLHYYYDKLHHATNPLAVEQEATELLYVIGDAALRAFIHWFDMSPSRFNHVGTADKSEIEAYMQRRHSEAKDIKVELNDPHTNRCFDISITAEESGYTLRNLNLDALMALDSDVFWTMKDPSGAMIGLAVIIPINRRTLPYLQQSMRSAPFFNGLAPEQTKAMAVPETMRSGWFIETIDTLDFGNPMQQAATGHLLYAMMLTGELIVESPAPLPYFIMAHESLGFERVQNAVHYGYDGVTPTPTFVFNWKGEQFIHYIHHILNQTELGRKLLSAKEAEEPARHAVMPNVDPILAHPELTPREKDVAKLLEKGLTNAEIAAALYVSEITVKKHMTSMLGKLNASNRTQLLKKLLEPSL